MNWEIDRWRLALGLVLAGALSGAIYAQAEITVVSPSILAEMEGNDESAGGNVCKFQILYSSSDFESVPESHRLITGFAWRPDEANQWSDPATGPVRFRLSTTTADRLTANFEENLGENAQIVFDGELTWQTDNDPPDGPRDFDYVVTFDDPYEYNGGSLVLELQDTAAWNNTTLVNRHTFLQ